jgi:formylmethanofuran dehydrogenase subunit E
VVQRLKKTFPALRRPVTKVSVMWLVSKLKISMNSLADLGFFMNNIAKTEADLKTRLSSDSVSVWEKTECLPDGITVSEQAVRVPLQNLLNKWAER